MAWFVVVDDTTGRLQTAAFQDPVAPSVNPPLIVIPLAGPPSRNEMWDEGTRTYVPRPPRIYVDRAQDVINDPRLNNVNQGTKNQVLNVINEVFGTERWRRDNESINIGGVPGSDTPPE